MSAPYLTVSEAADELAISTSGVYKLIQRGRLPAIRLSERGLRVSRLALEAYQRRLRGEVGVPPVKYSTRGFDELRAEFEADTGTTPAEWERRWQDDEIEDSAENMRLAVRAMSLLLHGRSDQPRSEDGRANRTVSRRAAA
ncbi:MAG: helix-turn-helix domain-containing protein [Solirubrobacteraceae bacterium]